MTTKNKKQTVNFSKFFPESDAFVTLKGSFNPQADSVFDDKLDIDLTIQSSLDRSVNLYSWGLRKADTLNQLKAIHEATGKAIKFYEDIITKKSAPIDFAPTRVLKTRK
jgi:hypothetical protein